MSTNDIINKYYKQTAKNHENLKKDCVNSYYNGALGANLDVNSLSKSELDYHFEQTLKGSPILNSYYQGSAYLYKPFS